MRQFVSLLFTVLLLLIGASAKAQSSGGARRTALSSFYEISGRLDAEFDSTKLGYLMLSIDGSNIILSGISNGLVSSYSNTSVGIFGKESYPVYYEASLGISISSFVDQVGNPDSRRSWGIGLVPDLYLGKRGRVGRVQFSALAHVGMPASRSQLQIMNRSVYLSAAELIFGVGVPITLGEVSALTVGLACKPGWLLDKVSGVRTYTAFDFVGWRGQVQYTYGRLEVGAWLTHNSDYYLVSESPLSTLDLYYWQGGARCALRLNSESRNRRGANFMKFY